MRRRLVWAAAGAVAIVGGGVAVRRALLRPMAPATPVAVPTPTPPAPAQASATPPTAPRPAGTAPSAATATPPEPTWRHLPDWHGFNLTEKINAEWGIRPFQRRDVEWIAELGFSFIRVPMDYRAWTEPHDWTILRQSVLEEIDQLLRWSEEYGLHVCLNFHRTPGYSVSPPPEALSVWTDEEPLRVSAVHWSNFARRYRAIPNRLLSFNPINEPPAIDPALHRRVIARLVEAIRLQDQDRLIICDGTAWGTAPPGELVGLNVAASTHAYQPLQLTHRGAEWIDGAEHWPVPTYPLREAETGGTYDRAAAFRREIAPWVDLGNRGVATVVGEFGVYNRTPHAVTLAWMRDHLDLWRAARWGWALWNFRGPFGVIDSGRSDVTYERWRGVQLDRAMLNLLRDYAAPAPS